MNEEEKREKEASTSLKVFVRVRPMGEDEAGIANAIFVGGDGVSIRVSNNYRIQEAKFEKVFDQNTTQSQIYEYVKDSVVSVSKGINCTIMAYGQTGSGKTYSMFGPVWEYFPSYKYIDFPSLRSENQLKGQEELGIIERSIQNIFTHNNYTSNKDSSSPKNSNMKLRIPMQEFTIYCSFIQIYNEKLYDLLQDSNCECPLIIREEKYQGIFVEGLTEYVVTNTEECLALLARGGKTRVIAKTKHNVCSSRSHTIFQLQMESNKPNKEGMLHRAKLNLCDLAGSEKLGGGPLGHMGGPNPNAQGLISTRSHTHFLELKTINLSLTSLGKVIFALANKSMHIPYRDSKMTRLLQDSIGGNTNTVLLSTISPGINCADESFSTINFAFRAKRVQISAQPNLIDPKDDALISQLQKELLYLKDLLNISRRGADGGLHRYMLNLEEENVRLREIGSGREVTEVEGLKKENKRMRLELQKLREAMQPKTPASPSTSMISMVPSSSQYMGIYSGEEHKEFRTINQFYRQREKQLKDIASQERLKEIKQAANQISHSMTHLNRCPICTLPLPCKHHKVLTTAKQVDTGNNRSNTEGRKDTYSPKPIPQDINIRTGGIATPWSILSCNEQSSGRSFYDNNPQVMMSSCYNGQSQNEYSSMSKVQQHRDQQERLSLHPSSYEGESPKYRGGGIINNVHNAYPTVSTSTSSQISYHVGKNMNRLKTPLPPIAGGKIQNIQNIQNIENIQIRVRQKQGGFKIFKGSLDQGIQHNRSKSAQPMTLARNKSAHALSRLKVIQKLENERELRLNHKFSGIKLPNKPISIHTPMPPHNKYDNTHEGKASRRIFKSLEVLCRGHGGSYIQSKQHPRKELSNKLAVPNYISHKYLPQNPLRNEERQKVNNSLINYCKLYPSTKEKYHSVGKSSYDPMKRKHVHSNSELY